MIVELQGDLLREVDVENLQEKTSNYYKLLSIFIPFSLFQITYLCCVCFDNLLNCLCSIILVEIDYLIDLLYKFGLFKRTYLVEF